MAALSMTSGRVTAGSWPAAALSPGPGAAPKVATALAVIRTIAIAPIRPIVFMVLLLRRTPEVVGDGCSMGGADLQMGHG